MDHTIKAKASQDWQVARKGRAGLLYLYASVGREPRESACVERQKHVPSGAHPIMGECLLLLLGLGALISRQ